MRLEQEHLWDSQSIFPVSTNPYPSLQVQAGGLDLEPPEPFYNFF